MLDCVNKLDKNRQRKQVMVPLNEQPLEEKNVRVPVPDELYELVLEAAQKAGESTEEFLRRILREKLRDVPAALERSAT